MTETTLETETTLDLKALRALLRECRMHAVGYAPESLVANLDAALSAPAPVPATPAPSPLDPPQNIGAEDAVNPRPPKGTILDANGRVATPAPDALVVLREARKHVSAEHIDCRGVGCMYGIPGPLTDAELNAHPDVLEYCTCNYRERAALLAKIDAALAGRA